jgi:magnesium transporter
MTADSSSLHNSEVDVSTPLLTASFWGRESPSRQPAPTAGTPGGPLASRISGIFRRRSPSSTRSTRSMQRSAEHTHSTSRDLLAVDFDVNNPPSVPGSPRFDADHGLPSAGDMAGELLIDIDSPLSIEQSAEMPGLKKRLTVAAEEDVCFPQDILSEIAEEEMAREAGRESLRARRQRRRAWPDLAILLEWSVMEKEERVEGIRARRVNEPLLVDGRLRARKAAWRREVEDAPYRFTYFNEEFETTIHSQTISELVQPGQTFEDLFVPKPPIISDESSEEEETSGYTTLQGNDLDRKVSGSSGMFRGDTLRSETSRQADTPISLDQSTTPDRQNSGISEKQIKHGPRPVFWLDVLNPSDAEMKVLSKAFGIHPLTAEDILMQEAREKVELFRHYYFVNYRSFEQDEGSDDYMEPVNMYVVVFREGIISFHFSQTPHPANVRRRIRQLSDYLFVTTDWISYALIDDVTDAYIPLIQRIEDEVDALDDLILSMQGNAFADGQNRSHADMLRQMGDCRKKVMRLYRLLGTKADVIKGFAKRCNEQWEVAPKSEIGMYLGDIQDHIVTMTGNLSHYEK